MKKLLAIILGMALMSPSFTTRTEAISPNTQTQSLESQLSLTDSIENKEVEDGKLTLELLQKMSSWEELVNTSSLISDTSLESLENKEDVYCVWLIEDLNFSSNEWANHCARGHIMGGLELKEIDYNRLMQKYQTIIDIYNASNDLQIVWKPKILDDKNFQVTTIPIFKVGQQVVLEQGATYWESTWNGGSGKHGIATDTNHYIPEDYIVTINGFAYLDKSRTTILKTYYKPYNELEYQEVDINLVDINPLEEFFVLHICTESTDLGWVSLIDVVEFIY